MWWMFDNCVKWLEYNEIPTEPALPVKLLPNPESPEWWATRDEEGNWNDTLTQICTDGATPVGLQEIYIPPPQPPSPYQEILKQWSQKMDYLVKNHSIYVNGKIMEPGMKLLIGVFDDKNKLQLKPCTLKSARGENINSLEIVVDDDGIPLKFDYLETIFGI
jgi:hypothetical protein